MDADDPDTWYPDPPRKSIMVEIYQHPALWATRQYPRVHQAFSEIWGTEKLWVSFDRASMSPPNLPEKFERTNLGLHWDTSVDIPFRFHVQGVLYLTDTAADQGAFTCVPGFHNKIEAWIKSLPEDADPRQQDLVALGAVPVPGKAGDLVIWHSALPHSAGINTADAPRVAQYITMSPTGETNPEARERRINAWKERMAGFSGERPEKGECIRRDCISDRTRQKIVRARNLGMNLPLNALVRSYLRWCPLTDGKRLLLNLNKGFDHT